MTDLGNKQVMAKNLKHYIEKSGKTQKELAEIVGVASSTFNDWTKGKKYPRIDKIEILANYFGILKSDLIEDKTKERYEMQKNNDIISNIIIKLRQDDDFLSATKILYDLTPEQMTSVKNLLAAFKK